ncbi:MAG: hypothetical protein K0R18_576 [Bacillales bacterium]|jgi:hypothetical protein|nr:hypothetical protein [Bacillales bacterium]
MPVDTKGLLRALGGLVAPQYFNKTSDQYEVWEGSNGAANVTLAGSNIAYDVDDDMFKVKSLQKKWKTDFIGSALNTDKWEVVRQGAGQTIVVSNSELKINAGVTPLEETVLLSKETFLIPVRGLFAFQLSQKIVNQEFIFAFVSVDPVTGVPDNLDVASWRISGDDSVTGDYAVYTVQTGGATPLPSAAVDTNVTHMASYALYEIELFNDEAWFHARAMDSEAGRSYSKVRHSSIPHPEKTYKIMIKARNKAVAPASATDFKFQFINITDYAELTAEITAGRGNTVAGQGIAANIMTMPTTLVKSAVVAADGVSTSSTSGAGAMVSNIQHLWNGASYDRQRLANLTKYAKVTAAGVVGTLTAWTPASAKKFRLHTLLISADVDCVLDIKDGTTSIMTVYVPAKGIIPINLPVNGHLSAAANNKLDIGYNAVTGNIAVTAFGNEE